MHRINIRDDLRLLAQNNHREIQGYIEIVSNRIFGIEVERINGIYKYEGGVKVNNRSICIKYDYVIDDFNRHARNIISEEVTVGRVIHDFFNEFDIMMKFERLCLEQCEFSLINFIHTRLNVNENNILNYFVNNSMVNPLVSFFNL